MFSGPGVLLGFMSATCRWRHKGIHRRQRGQDISTHFQREAAWGAELSS